MALPFSLSHPLHSLELFAHLERDDNKKLPYHNKYYTKSLEKFHNFEIK
jgi:hypothetical protein